MTAIRSAQPASILVSGLPSSLVPVWPSWSPCTEAGSRYLATHGPGVHTLVLDTVAGVGLHLEPSLAPQPKEQLIQTADTAWEWAGQHLLTSERSANMQVALFSNLSTVMGSSCNVPPAWEPAPRQNSQKCRPRVRHRVGTAYSLLPICICSLTPPLFLTEHRGLSASPRPWQQGVYATEQEQQAMEHPHPLDSWTPASHLTAANRAAWHHCSGADSKRLASSWTRKYWMSQVSGCQAGALQMSIVICLGIPMSTSAETVGRQERMNLSCGVRPQPNARLCMVRHSYWLLDSSGPGSSQHTDRCSETSHRSCLPCPKVVWPSISN